MKKRISLLMLVALAITLFAGCGNSTPPSQAPAPAAPASTDATPSAAPAAPSASGELNIYTTVSELQYNSIVGAFQKTYPEIKINFTQAGAGECKTRIKAEAANPQGDVMFGGLVYADTLTYGQLFESYVCTNDSKMPDSFKNTTGVLTYHDTQIPVLWVNDALEKKLGITIKGYSDLLDTKLKGQIASGDPTASSSAWNQLQCILTDFGGHADEKAWTYIDGLMKNLVITDGSSAVYKGVFNGEYTVGLTYEPACVQMLSEGAEGVHMVYPAEGVTGISFGSAIIKNCKNLDNAKLFMDFLAGDECQKIYNECGARQANSNLKINNEWLPALDTIAYREADTKGLAENQPAILERWASLWKTQK